MNRKLITTRRSVVKRTLALVLAIAAGGIVATASFATPTARSGALHATKECSQYNGQAGSFCTITSSNLKAIDVGSKVIYAQPAGAAGLDSDLHRHVQPDHEPLVLGRDVQLQPARALRPSVCASQRFDCKQTAEGGAS